MGSPAEVKLFHQTTQPLSEGSRLDTSNSLLLHDALLQTQFPDKVPSNLDYSHTTLQGIEGRYTHELIHKQWTQWMLCLLGFKRPREFASMECYQVANSGDLNTYVDLEGTVIDLTPKIIGLINSGHKLGIRISNPANNMPADLPFAHIGNIKNPLLVWNESKTHLIGIQDSRKREPYLFKAGDTISIFVESDSLEAQMQIPPHLPSSTECTKIPDEPIKLGGGFVLQFIGLECQSVTCRFVAVLNDRNPRDIDLPQDTKASEYTRVDPDSDELVVQYETTLSIPLDQNNYWTLPENYHYDLQASIDSKDIDAFMCSCLYSFINQNGQSLSELFTLLLSLDPQTHIHSIKGGFTTQLDDNHQPISIFMVQDVESSEQKQSWQRQRSLDDVTQRLVAYLPPKNSDRVSYLVDQCSLLSIPPTPKQALTAMFLSNRSIIKRIVEAKFYLHPGNHKYRPDEITGINQLVQNQLFNIRLLIDRLSNHLPVSIIDSLKQHIHTSSTNHESPINITTEFTPPVALAHYLRNITAPKQWQTDTKNPEITIMERGHHKFIRINVQGYELAFWFIRGEIINLTQLAGITRQSRDFHPLGRQVITCLAPVIAQALCLPPTNIVPAQLPHREGD